MIVPIALSDLYILRCAADAFVKAVPDDPNKEAIIQALKNTNDLGDTCVEGVRL